MRKKHLIILILMIISLICINIEFGTLINKWKIDYSIHILANDKIVYIPKSFDSQYYVQYKLLKNKEVEKRPIPYLHLINALYNLRDIPESKIEELLYNSHSNLRIYGYIYYLRKNQDIYFDYLLQSFDSNEKVFLDHQYVYDECYVRDVLLLIALGGADLFQLLPGITRFLYELTYEQWEILKLKYEENRSFSDIMDKVIGEYFNEYW